MRLSPQRRAFLAASTAVTLGFGLAACSSSSKAGSPDGTPTVAMVTPESTGEFYGAMYCGAKAAAKEQGVDLKIQGTPEVTVDAEMQVLQSVLATEPDGLLLTVWDNNAFNQTLKPYTSTGKPLVMPDSYLSDDSQVQSIRTDSYKSSYDAALKVVEDFKVASGKVLIVTDAPGNAIQTARAEGFRDAIKTKAGLEVLEFQYVGGDAAKASQAVSSARSANKDLALVFSTNIGAGTGSANGIGDARDSIVHVGYDTSSAQVEELKGNGYDALIAQSPYKMGYESTTLISQLVKGEKKAADITEKTVYSPWALVTAANVGTADIAPYLYTTDCSKVS
ncbi:monosaccharide ABC transporter substrate-binding protein, CUT2 family [Micromonospora pallida]|uniref:Monosaccharide ABC transporter substrate-binding protein, CUT2 family n=1 Tax=Micromonospora pallida TaxID=145854 RepID=A0A1C6T615_9ACTN|nr:substrate-binding domain-containing protein [Micromonospora pallida]SCL37012.1 monosaccharide ABC transporter substrate-binding protein, CUT2 family [Micromonospora pallida]